MENNQSKGVIHPMQGLRFEMHGAKFEISFVANGSVRYSGIGGQSHQINFDRFMELQISGTIIISDTTLPGLTSHDGPAVMRRHRYVQAALRTLSRPTARGPLAEVINDVSMEIVDPSPPSTRTVAYWIRAFRTAGFSGLIPRTGQGNSTLRFGVEVEQLIHEAIQHQYLQREGRRADIVFCRIVGRGTDLGIIGPTGSMRIPTQRTIQRRLKKLDPYVVEKAQQGQLAAGKVARAAGRSLVVAKILQIVQMDTHMLDVIVVDPDTGEVLGRPYLTCILDVNSRAIVGTYISLLPPSATTALGGLKDMLTRSERGLPGGICVMVIPDNGVEFANSAFILLCETLAITISPAQKRDPNGKAHIESFFRTLTFGIVQLLPGTTFSHPNARGDYDSNKRACFTLENIKTYIDQWINSVYHKTIHSRTGRAPLVAWNEQAKVSAPATLTTTEANAIARRPYHRTIQNGRVQFEGLTYFSHALATMRAQGIKKVKILVDELDMQTVFVEHPTERGSLILAESTEPDYTTGLTLYAHAESIKIKKAMSAADQRELGLNANLLARWQLVRLVQNDSQVARKKIRALTAGLGRKKNVDDQCKNPPVTETNWRTQDSPPPSSSSGPRGTPLNNGTWDKPMKIQTIELE